MNKFWLILMALLLSACANRSMLDVPQQIQYNGKNYQLNASQDLGTMARFVYVVAPETWDNWQSQIELLLDRNIQPTSIKERIVLRERVYRNLDVADFKLTPLADKNKPAYGLNAYVIYAPTAQNPSWQVDVARGQNVANCGFVQFQYSQKVRRDNKFTRLDEPKVLKYLQKYLLSKEQKQLQKMPWQWHCVK